MPLASPSPRSEDSYGANSPADEGALLARLRAGDAAAFESLVRSYGPRLFAVARRFLRNDEDARDAVQDAFLSTFRALDGFSGQSRLGTWLHRIVVNEALMRLRSRKRRHEESIEDLLPRFQPDGHEVSPTAGWCETGDVAIERQERSALVRKCIDRLPESYRAVLLLRDIEELDTQEAAGLLGISENATKIRLHRARQALRTLLDPHFSVCR